MQVQCNLQGVPICKEILQHLIDARCSYVFIVAPQLVWQRRLIAWLLSWQSCPMNQDIICQCGSDERSYVSMWCCFLEITIQLQICAYQSYCGLGCAVEELSILYSYIPWHDYQAPFVLPSRVPTQTVTSLASISVVGNILTTFMYLWKMHQSSKPWSKWCLDANSPAPQPASHYSEYNPPFLISL